MRIAYLVNQYPKGSHTFIRREVNALEKLGVEVNRVSIRDTFDLCIDEQDTEEWFRTHVILQGGIVGLMMAVLRAALRTPAGFLQAFRTTWKLGRKSPSGLLRHFVYLAEAASLRQYLRREGVAHVHAHFGTNSTTVALLCAKLGGVSFSFTVHGPEEFDHPAELGLAEKVAAARFAVAISSYGRSQLLRWSAPNDWDKIHEIHCGVDARYLSYPVSPVTTARRIVCVGRLAEQKGQLVLIEALKALRDEGIAVELHFVGDGPMRPLLERRVRESNLEGFVHFDGWRDEPGVRESLERARALVIPSFAEGLPVVIMEAFAMGRPVISTYVAGMPELVKPGVSGWLVPAGSVSHLADALRELMAAPAEALEEMGMIGRKSVCQRHDAAEEARKLLRLFREHVLPESKFRPQCSVSADAGPRVATPARLLDFATEASRFAFTSAPAATKTRGT